MLVFAGEAFDSDIEYKRLKSLLIGTHLLLHSVNGSLRFHLSGNDVFLFHYYMFLSISLTHLSDFFRGPTVSAVRLAGLEHVLHFTAVEGKIYMRSYR